MLFKALVLNESPIATGATGMEKVKIYYRKIYKDL